MNYGIACGMLDRLLAILQEERSARKVLGSGQGQIRHKARQNAFPGIGGDRGRNRNGKTL